MKSKYFFINENKITATLVDGNYLWIAFYGISGLSTLYKSSVFNPNFRYWDIDIEADEITSMIQDNDYIDLALRHDTYIGVASDKTNPLYLYYWEKEEGMSEYAIDLILDGTGTYIYFLTPGEESGENAKIHKYDYNSMNFIETIDLDDVFNAKKIDIDGDENLWVLSNLESIPIITKVWMETGWVHSNQELS